MSETTQTQKTQASRSNQFKEQALKEPDSVFMLPFGGAKGVDFIHQVRNLDKIVNNVKRKAVLSIPLPEVKATLEKVAEVSDKMWGLVKKHIPNLYDADRLRWRVYNDSYEEKRFLSQRRNVFWLLPRTEETGQIAVAMKIIHKQCIKLQQEDIEAYGNLISDYVKIIEDMKKLHDDIKQKFSLSG